MRAGAGCGCTVGSTAKVSSRARRLFGSASENDEPDALLAGTRDLRAAPGEPLAWSGPDNISASVEIDCAARDAVVDIALVASSSSYETTASHEVLAANRFPAWARKQAARAWQRWRALPRRRVASWRGPSRHPEAPVLLFTA